MHPQIQAALISALVALLIAAGPHVWRWLRPGRIEVDVHDDMALSTRLGFPRVALHVTARNAGGRSLRVKSWAVRVQPRDREGFDLPGRGFFEKFNDESAALLTPFDLKQDGDWSHTINFYRMMPRADDARARELEHALQNSIREKRRALGLSRDAPPIEADEEYWRPLVGFFNEHFRMAHGEYELILKVQVEGRTSVFEKSFRFVLFEADEQALRRVVEDFPYGGLGRTAVFPQLTQV
jgi:hypothetical protein